MSDFFMCVCMSCSYVDGLLERTSVCNVVYIALSSVPLYLNVWVAIPSSNIFVLRAISPQRLSSE